MKKNIVYKFFLNLAQFYGIDKKYGWKSRLWEKIGTEADIASANLMHTWIARGFIPEESLNKILLLDLPTEIEALARDCLKYPGFIIESVTTKRVLPLPKENDEWYLKAVNIILKSGDLGIIEALKSNITQFHEAIKNKKRISTLEKDVQNLKELIENMGIKKNTTI